MSDLIRRALPSIGRFAPEGEFLLCRVKPGPNWWSLDDEVAALASRKITESRSAHLWYAVSTDRIAALEAIAERNPRSLLVYRAK